MTVMSSKDEIIIITCTVLTCRHFWQCLVDHNVPRNEIYGWPTKMLLNLYDRENYKVLV